MPDGPFCNCSEGYIGKYCDKSSCKNYEKCLNGIRIYYIGECIENLTNVFCNCSDGWTGKYCEISTCETYNKCKNGIG